MKQQVAVEAEAVEAVEAVEEEEEKNGEEEEEEEEENYNQMKEGSTTGKRKSRAKGKAFLFIMNLNPIELNWA